MIMIPWCCGLATVTTKLLSQFMQLWFYVVLFVLSYICLLTCYSRLYTQLWQRRVTWLRYPRGSHTSAILQQTQKARRLILALISCVIICSLPASVDSLLVLLEYYRLVDLHTFRNNIPFHAFAITCVQLNSSLNPILYFGVSDEFCHAFRTLFRRLRRTMGCCYREEVSPMSNNTPTTIAIPSSTSSSGRRSHQTSKMCKENNGMTICMESIHE